MDKLFHKSEKDYVRQVEKLKQELERKDKIAKVNVSCKVKFNSTLMILKFYIKNIYSSICFSFIVHNCHCSAGYEV